MYFFNGPTQKFFMKLKNPIQFHYYCTFCMEYQGLSIPDDKLCKNRCCLKDLSKKENSSYFIIIPLMCQLRDLMQSKWSLSIICENSIKISNTIQWNPDFSNPRFPEPPDFSNQFSFPLEVREIGIPLYNTMGSVSHTGIQMEAVYHKQQHFFD